MRRRKGKGPVHVVQNEGPEVRSMLFRTKMLNWLKQANFEPDEALSVLVSAAGIMAAGLKVGKRKFKKACGKAYEAEWKRLLAAKLEDMG